jgi:sugar lactone lactonase YvrE
VTAVASDMNESTMSEEPAAHRSTDPLHPPHDAVPVRPVPTEVVAEWPAGTFLENLTFDPDGRSWLVTSPTDCAVYRVGPDKSVHTAAQFDRTPTGIAAHPDIGTVAAVGTQGRADWRLFRITANGPQAVCDLPDVLGANGMTWAGDRLLVADSPRSVVVAVDVADRTADVWLQHPLITPMGADSPLPGINGLAVDRDWVLMTSSDRGLVLRVPAASRDPAADLEVVAERLVGDDLAVVPDGRIFVATHTFHSVLCLYPDGHREDVAGHGEHIAGPTAVAVGDFPSPALYVTTTGGLLSPPGNEVEPARLVRVDALRTLTSFPTG